MIIGITGTFGSGKGEVSRYLETKGFIHYSVTAVLVDEIKRRGLPVNRDTMYMVANDLRSQDGKGVLVKRLVDRASEDGATDFIIESIRAPDEVRELKKHQDVLIVSVDADQKTRFQRIRERKSEKDDITFEQFTAQEDAEYHGTSPSGAHILECMRLADVTLQNDGTLEELHSQIDLILNAASFDQTKHI